MARADRPALMPAASGGPPGTEPARRAVEAVWRIGSARIVGALARYTGDFELAEDVAQEAVAEALVTWPRQGAGEPGGLAAGDRAAAGHRQFPPPVGIRCAVHHARRPARRG